jgi:hypothetical protein
MIEKVLTSAFIVIVGIAIATILITCAFEVALSASKSWRIYNGDAPCLVYRS